MARYEIPLGSGYGDTSVPRAREVFGSINAMTAQIYADAQGARRYVSNTYGNDAEDGKTWFTAKATVDAAIASLPNRTVNSVPNVPYGEIVISQGDHTLSSIVNYCSGFVITGMGVGTGTTGSRIIASGSHPGHMFNSVTGGSDNHGALFQDVILKGHKPAQPSAAYDIMTANGGFNTLLRNVVFQEASRWALQIKGGLMNYMAIGLSFAECGSSSQGGAIWMNGISGGSQITFINGQVDDCGVIPILIQSDESGKGKCVNIFDYKVEGALHLTHNTHAIQYIPNSAGGDPVMINIDGLYVNNFSSGWSLGMFGGAVHQAGGTGPTAIWKLGRIYPDGQYLKAFEDDKNSGNDSVGGQMIRGSYRGSEFPTIPHFEFAGVGIYAGAVSPPTMSAPNGSIYYSSVGAGTTDNVYVRRGGAWVGVH